MRLIEEIEVKFEIKNRWKLSERNVFRYKEQAIDAVALDIGQRTGSAR